MRILRLFPVFLSGYLGAQEACEKEDDSADAWSRLSVLIERTREDHSVPALAVGIIEDGKVFYQRGFGITAGGDAVTVETRFRVASISKIVTAMAVMQLEEKGRVSLKEKVDTYLPELKHKNITLQELLTHHSGLKDKVRPSDKRTISGVSAYLAKSGDKNSRTKKEFEYADVNFNALGVLVERVSGKPYPEYVSEHILKPLGLKNSGFASMGKEYRPDVLPYFNKNKVRPAPNRPYDPAFESSEGLVTSAHDLLILLLANLQKDKQLLRKATYEKMWQPKKNTSWEGIKIGLAWQLYRDQHGPVIQHAGSFKGVKTLLIGYPEIKRGIVILSNADKLPRWEIVGAINCILNNDTQTSE